MIIYFIYLIISLILIFVFFTGIKAASRGIQAKKKLNTVMSKRNFREKLSSDNTNLRNLSKLNDLYKSGVITKKELVKGTKKIKKKDFKQI